MSAICPVCGSNFVPYTRGRTRTFCSSNCRDISKFMNALESRLLASKCSITSKALILGDIFRLANSFRFGTNSLRSKND